ncbi:MAG: DUF2231 domain-containing protein [Pseudoxanthomonas suwonensis]|nr:DUF2231 domain-containing protein [Pseudoxanthomonas suwonensis]
MVPSSKPPENEHGESTADPVAQALETQRTESLVAIHGHPIHAMVVTLPIALTFCTLLADLAYWWTGDPFWARAALWAIGSGFLFGLLAGLTGTAELLLVPGIRKRSAPWTHFILAMTLLAIIGLNWGLRLRLGNAIILPVGLAASVLGWIFTVWTGWHGGKLVFDHHLGTSDNGN